MIRGDLLNIKILDSYRSADATKPSPVLRVPAAIDISQRGFHQIELIGL
jgi:hypothetical protein